MSRKVKHYGKIAYWSVICLMLVVSVFLWMPLVTRAEVPSNNTFLAHDNSVTTYTTYNTVYIICIKVADGTVWDNTTSTSGAAASATWANCGVAGTIETTFDYVLFTIPSLPNGHWDIKIYESADATKDSGDTYLTGFRVISPNQMTGYSVPQ